MQLKPVFSVLIASTFANFAWAIETGDMPLQIGYVDPETGVRVERIVTSPDQQLQEIYLSLPRETGDIEEVIVRAKSLKKPALEQKRPYRFVKDYANDRYGLVIYLDKSEEWPVRLYLDARQEEP